LARDVQYKGVRGERLGIKDYGPFYNLAGMFAANDHTYTAIDADMLFRIGTIYRSQRIMFPTVQPNEQTPKLRS
jgi:hypothetical protein